MVGLLTISLEALLLRIIISLTFTLHAEICTTKEKELIVYEKKIIYYFGIGNYVCLYNLLK
jgi:hypothetical protein